MAADKPYRDGVETPLETASRPMTAVETTHASDALAEREADVVVGDVDDYVAETNPAGLASAEAALDAWQIPTSPLEGVPSDIALHPGEDGEPLVSVFSAGSESEANIVHGLLESSGIPAIMREVATPSYGSIFSVSEARWADIFVPEAQAQAARDAINEAMQSVITDEDVEERS